MTRLLILNPNTTQAVTDLMMRSATAVVSPGVELSAMTASRGLPYISSRAEALIGGAIALETLAEVAPAPDAAILAAFGDPGLFALREALDFPIIGVSEAAMLAACMLGGKFLIVSFTSAMLGWYRDCVAMHGLEARCAGVVALDLPFAALEDVQGEQGEALIDFARAEARAKDAACIIFAGRRWRAWRRGLAEILIGRSLILLRRRLSSPRRSSPCGLSKQRLVHSRGARRRRRPA